MIYNQLKSRKANTVYDVAWNAHLEVQESMDDIEQLASDVKDGDIHPTGIRDVIVDENMLTLPSIDYLMSLDIIREGYKDLLRDVISKWHRLFDARHDIVTADGANRWFGYVFDVLSEFDVILLAGYESKP